jgi:hypothetical protein
MPEQTKESSNSDPYLGAMVHYRFVDSGVTTCLAAIVTATPEDLSRRLALHVFTLPGQFTTEAISVGDVPHSVQGEASTWHLRQECYG